jgi:hypothetical protein
MMSSKAGRSAKGPLRVPHPTLAAIHNELEEAPTRYTIDVVDFMRVPEKFREIAQRQSACAKVSITASRFRTRDHTSR